MSVEDGDQELTKEFLVESHENLDQMDRNLIQLEKDPHSREALASVFRAIHTIKGTCGFLGFGRLEALAHAGESLLSRLRDQELEFDAVIATALLAMVDAIRSMLAVIESTGHEGEEDARDLVARLKSLQFSETTGAAAVPPPTTTAAAPASPSFPEVPPAVNAEPVKVEAKAEARIETKPDVGGDAKVAEGSGDKGHSVSDAHVRVPVELLDSLMNMVGELVLVRNQIIQFVPHIPHQGLTTTSQRLSFITTELQGEVMKTRMQPIRNIWDKFPRVVRDLAVICHKQVTIHMEGQDTELDKTIIEAIKDPLTHLVRNCVDHGIEAAADRVAAGKTAEGRLSLRAFHEGGQVIIEISDDGKGLDVDGIRRKALERGLINAEAAERMSEQDFYGLVFLPGFSTAKVVSNVSGRGVGMDVVKTNIERIGGSVDLQSKRGHGTTFRIKIPLTLAIVPALVVASSGDRYAIPQSSLVELVRLEGQEGLRSIELIHGTPVYRLRGKLLPLVYLDQELGRSDGIATTGGGVVNIVVLTAEEKCFGLVVQGVSDTQEIVVKPLGQLLKGLNIFAGATIMGDGRVALILDVMGLAQRSSVLGETHVERRAEASAVAGTTTANQTWLLFRTADGRRMAIPLDQVARLEVLPRKRLERLGGQEVVQYRGEILPLVDLAAVVPGGGAFAIPIDDPAELERDVDVVVYNQGRGRSVGLMVGKILDIVEEAVTVNAGHGPNGLARCGIVRNAVAELPDLKSLFGIGADSNEAGLEHGGLS